MIQTGTDASPAGPPRLLGKIRSPLLLPKTKSSLLTSWQHAITDHRTNPFVRPHHPRLAVADPCVRIPEQHGLEVLLALARQVSIGFDKGPLAKGLKALQTAGQRVPTTEGALGSRSSFSREAVLRDARPWDTSVSGPMGGIVRGGGRREVVVHF